MVIFIPFINRELRARYHAQTHQKEWWHQKDRWMTVGVAVASIAVDRFTLR